MTKDEYRQHMRKYSRDTMVMSFVVHDHPDYQALQAAGDEIIPWLLADLVDPDWHCNSCYGDGFEYPAGWQEEWDKNRVWPTDTGIPCHECKGKGNVCVHACMHLLWEKVGDDAPVIEKWMRGRVAALTDLWRKWGERKGYLPPTPDKPRLGILARVINLFKARDAKPAL
jgi:hypothetical protein